MSRPSTPTKQEQEHDQEYAAKTPQFLKYSTRHDEQIIGENEKSETPHNKPDSTSLPKTTAVYDYAVQSPPPLISPQPSGSKKSRLRARMKASTSSHPQPQPISGKTLVGPQLDFQSIEDAIRSAFRKHAIQPPSPPPTALANQQAYPLSHTSPLSTILAQPPTTTPSPAFHILKPPSDLSPYYSMPILDRLTSSPNHSLILPSDSDSESDGDGNIPLTTYTEKRGIRHSDIKTWQISPDHLHPQPARMMPPSQSLILYLWGRGLPMDFIAAELGNLHPRFLYSLSSVERWHKVMNFNPMGNGGEGDRVFEWERREGVVVRGGEMVRVGAHWEMGGREARAVVEGWVLEEEDWEREGCESEEGLGVRKRGRGVKVGRLGVMCLENYLSWRLRGYWEHRDVCV